jgi:hypothetical protein
LPTIAEFLCISLTLPTAEVFLTYCCRRTSNKIVIGTVFVLDDKVREPISVQHLLCKCSGVLHIYRSPSYFTCARYTHDYQLHSDSITCPLQALGSTNLSSSHFNRRQCYGVFRQQKTTNGCDQNYGNEQVSCIVHELSPGRAKVDSTRQIEKKYSRPSRIQQAKRSTR